MGLLSTLARRVTGAPDTLLPDRAPLPEKLISNVVEAMDRIPEVVRASEGDWVHVSSLIGFCPRQYVLTRDADIPQLRTVTGGHRVMWRLGRAAEAHIREQYIKSVGGHRVLGRWTCLCKASTHVGFMPGPERTCPKCNQRLDQYGEYTVRDETLKIVGNPDLLPLHGDTIVMVEIKSMNAEEWNALKAPKGDHVYQAGWYYDLLRAEGVKVHRTGAVLYCIKDFKFGSPYKEYHVDLAAPELVRSRETDRESVRLVRASQAAERLPPRTLCAAPGCSLAKACPVATACFSRS